MSINPFPLPTPLQSIELKTLVGLTRRTYERGWNFATAGNFSIRGSNRLMWQSPSGVNKGNMYPQQFVPVDIDSLYSPRPDAARPSDETPLHAGIYRNAPMARAVLHVHSPALVRESQRREAMVFEGQEMGKAFGAVEFSERIEIPMIPNTQDMEALGQIVQNHMNPNIPVLILKGHGIYAWGPSSETALSYIEGLEFLCQTQL